jgi:hypothetical protein
MVDHIVDRLIASNDLDELLREIDRRCERSDWQGLMSLRDACARSHEHGRQMWPAASHAEYRMALEAPAAWAAKVITEGAAHLGLGPLTEVVASTHDWASLANELTPGPLRGAVAQERVVRGESIEGDQRAELELAEAPLRLQAWEPAYPVATYRAWKVEAPAPRPSGDAAAIRVMPRSAPSQRTDEVTALEDLARTSVAQSNGTSRAVRVEGDGPTAIAAILRDEPAMATPIDGSDALALMAWTAASGGAHGRRRGMAAGRATAWWTAAVLTCLSDEWPPWPDDLGEAIAEMEWWMWSTSGETGWTCRLAVSDPDVDLGWALDARDHD